MLRVCYTEYIYFKVDLYSLKAKKKRGGGLLKNWKMHLLGQILLLHINMKIMSQCTEY